MVFKCSWNIFVGNLRHWPSFWRKQHAHKKINKHILQLQHYKTVVVAKSFESKHTLQTFKFFCKLTIRNIINTVAFYFCFLIAFHFHHKFLKTTEIPKRQKTSENALSERKRLHIFAAIIFNRSRKCRNQNKFADRALLRGPEVILQLSSLHRFQIKFPVFALLSAI